MEGYQKALSDHNVKCLDCDVVECSNDNSGNYGILKKLFSERKHPDGIIASVEKLTTPVYLACKNLRLDIPKRMKVISFSNLDTALILDPPLTTIKSSNQLLKWVKLRQPFYLKQLKRKVSS